MRRAFIGLALFATAAAPAPTDPFAALRKAYATRDATAAAAAYRADAEVVYSYPGTPVERHRGAPAITASFRSLFDQIDPRDRLDLNFRETAHNGNRVQGVYRLKVGRGQSSYGRFDVLLDASGKFASDYSTRASAGDFEEAAGTVMLDASDETLDRRYYSQMAGRYRLPDGCLLVVTRSIVRLFMRNSCTNEWRGLSRRSGREWTAGTKILSDAPARIIRFAPIVDGVSPSVEVVDATGTQRAERITDYRTEDVSFDTADGTILAGTLYIPAVGNKRHAATVMLHGSGPQDRDGYASIIAVMADALAGAGRIVLAYDKRGSGASAGNGDRAGFGTLAADARAAMDFLARRPEVDASKIGLAGSSQAGWVAAKAIADGALPADVLLLGAAGAALTVAEQNRYNTAVRMRCQGLAAADIRLALSQQDAFFEFLRTPSAAARLDRLTAQARTRPGLRDWLFPDSQTTDRSADAWYVVLDPFFDPLPIWQRYRGRTALLFSQFDDSTPTTLAQSRLNRSGKRVTIFPQAQHLGLATRDICKGELADLSHFTPALIPAIARFALAGQ